MSITIDTLTQKIRAFRQQEAQFLTAAHEASGAAKAMEVMLSELVQAERKAKAEAAPQPPAASPAVESVERGYEPKGTPTGEPGLPPISEEAEKVGALCNDYVENNKKNGKEK